jgi:ribonuclease-3
MDPVNIQRVEEIIGHTFTRNEFLESALTTKAYLQEHEKEIGPKKEITHYRILEPIGDSVLDLIVTSELSKSKGRLNNMGPVSTKDRYVKEKNLEIIAKRMGLNNFLRMGNGETKKGIKDNKRVCDALVEALIAAVYLDSIDSDGKVDMKEIRKVIVENLDIFNKEVN